MSAEYETATKELTEIRLESATIAMRKEGENGRDEYNISYKKAEGGTTYTCSVCGQLLVLGKQLSTKPDQR